MPVATRTARLGLLANFVLCIFASALNVLFGFFKFTNSLNIRFYYQYSPKTINIVIFSNSVDFWIWIVSFFVVVVETLMMKMIFDPKVSWWPVLFGLSSTAMFTVFLINETVACLLVAPLGFVSVALMIYFGNGFRLSRREEAASLTLICIAGLLMLFEVASLSSWLLNIFKYETPFLPTARWIFPLIDLQLFNLFYPLTSWLFLLFLYSWMWIPILKHFLSRDNARVRSVSTRLRARLCKYSVSPVQNIRPKKLKDKYVALAVLLSMAVAAFVAYYPVTRAPSSTLVGVDALSYYDWLERMVHEGPFFAFSGDRPFFNFLMYSAQRVTGSPPETVVLAMPVVLAVCLSLTVFWFVKVGTKNDFMALLASLFSSFSFQMTVGVFAYFAANWLAIIESFVLFIFLLKSFEEKNSWKYIVMSAVVGMMLLLTYPYMWDVMMAILIFYLAWMFVKRNPERTQTKFLAFLLAANAAFYVGYSLTPFGGGVGNAAGAGPVLSSMSVSNFLNLQNGLTSIVEAWVGGLLGNPMLLILALVGVLAMFDFKENFNRMMLLWIMIPSLVLLAVTPDPYYYRFIYIVPFQVQAAAGLCWIVTRLENMRSRLKMSETSHTAMKITIALVMLYLLNYALRSVDGASIQMIP